MSNLPTKPERYTVAQVIEAIEATKGMVTMAARRLGCTQQTVRNYALRHPTVAAALKEQREGFLDVCELALMRAVQDGQGWAVCFALKTIGKERGYIERAELTGKDGEALTIRVVYDDVDTQLT